MDWIHCNNCFAQLEPGITLNLTSCGHMFCNTCLDSGVKESTCIICRLPCSIMKLVPDMKPEIQDYFTDPEEIVKKTCEVLQFQRQHRRRLLSYLLQSTKKFYTARTELKRITELCQKQHKQLRDYQKIVKNLEAQLAGQSKQTSPFNIPISPGSNISPSFIQSSPCYKRPAKSTPYNIINPSGGPSLKSFRFGSTSSGLLKGSSKLSYHSFGVPNASSSSGTSGNDEKTIVSPTRKQRPKKISMPCYQSNLVTPSRVSKQRSSCFSAQSQRSNTSNKISSTVFTPPTPESAGYSHFLKNL